ncbi:hypothetical protein, partial [Streptomyces sp. C1-2]|uniref:hypothetical protein n=1 Tax=Streptomyces sp. C1-2 TaxID=2720022 RepID=UPI003211D6A8
ALCDAMSEVLARREAAVDDLSDPAVLSRADPHGHICQSLLSLVPAEHAGGESAQSLRRPVERVGEACALVDLTASLHRGQHCTEDSL